MCWSHKYSSLHGHAQAHTICSCFAAPLLQKTSHDNRMKPVLFTQRRVGTPQSRMLPRKGFSHRQHAAAPAFPAILGTANSRPTLPIVPKHTERWLYPPGSHPFFRRKKSIEIDLKMSNLINCQLSLQDRYFMDNVNVWSHQGSNSVVSPINLQIFSRGLLQREVQWWNL